MNKRSSPNLVEAGRAALETECYAEAEKWYLAALKANQDHKGWADATLAEVLEGLSQVYCAQNMYARGRAFYRRLIRVKEIALGMEHHDVQALRTNLAMIRGVDDQSPNVGLDGEPRNAEAAS